MGKQQTITEISSRRSAPQILLNRKGAPIILKRVRSGNHIDKATQSPTGPRRPDKAAPVGKPCHSCPHSPCRTRGLKTRHVTALRFRFEKPSKTFRKYFETFSKILRFSAAACFPLAGGRFRSCPGFPRILRKLFENRASPRMKARVAGPADGGSLALEKHNVRRCPGLWSFRSARVSQLVAPLLVRQYLKRTSTNAYYGGCLLYCHHS